MKRLPPEDVRHVLRATEGLWRELHGHRLFLTGGSGFFGIWLLETVLAAAEEWSIDVSVVVLTRDRAAFAARLPDLVAHPAVTLIEGDVRTFDFPAGELRYVIHAAAEASATLNAQQPKEMFATIVGGTRQVLRLAASAGTRRLLFVSSGAIYGPQPPEVSHVAEDRLSGPSTTDPSSAYGEGKRAAELLCAMAAREHAQLEPLIARPFAFVGPGLPLDRHFAIGNFIADALSGRTIAVRGDGTPLRSYLYAADLAVWLWTILFRGQPLRPYNVGSDQAVSIAEVAARVAAAAHPPLDVTIAGTPDPARPPERYVPSTERGRSELDLQETVSLDEAIARTLTWHRSPA
jgi:nucleoside-diphosphate-sugar epimerase